MDEGKIPKEPLKYSPDLDVQVRDVMERSLGVKVDSVQKLDGGIVNHTFRLETVNGPKIFRVFANKNWPEEKTVRWVDASLEKAGIRRGKLEHFESGGENFPNGFMVSEFVEGRVAREMIDSGDLDEGEYFEKLGALLKEVHKISLPRFGQVNDGEGVEEDYVTYLAGSLIDKKKNKYVENGLFTEAQIAEISKKIEVLLSPYERRFRPVLIHRDANSTNAVVTPDREVVLIDWDNTRAEIPITDFNKITFAGNMTIEEGRDFTKSVMPAFFRGYGDHGLSVREMEDVRQAQHISYAYGLIDFFLFNKQNNDRYQKLRVRLDYLLSKEYDRSI